MIVDLHLHTNFSDGLLAPDKVVDLAIKRGLDGIAITDHDTILGIEPAIQRSKLYKDFFVIPGIEFSCVYMNEEVHILGYFLNYKSPKMINLTNHLRKTRVERGIKMIEKLNKIGINISVEEVNKYRTTDYIGRPLIGRALIQNNYVESMEEAFNIYLNRGKPGYVERYKIEIKDIIDIIHEENGIAVLAHPGLIKNEEIIFYCIHIGIDGIEAIHSKHTKQNISDFTKVAKAHNLIITGGSDCHGELINNDYLIGKYCVDLDNIPEMKRRLQDVYI